MVKGMPNISVKRLIKKAEVSPAPRQSSGLRGRVRKNMKKSMTVVNHDDGWPVSIPLFKGHIIFRADNGTPKAKKEQTDDKNNKSNL